MRPAARWLAPLVAAALSLLSLIPLPPPEPPTYTPPTPLFPAITVLSVGDSLTYGTDGSATASYRGELSRLMTKAGQPHTWKVAAVPGSTCGHWAQYLGAAITTYSPQLIVLNCGTNDRPGINNTEADYRTILAVATSRGVPIVASLIGRPYMGSPENVVRPWVDAEMDDTNSAIERALASYPNTPVAHFWRVPADPEWLAADGIHLTARSEAAYGQLIYQAVRASRGWLTLAQMRVTEMCGLHGVRRGAAWPTPDVAYRVCRS